MNNSFVQSATFYPVPAITLGFGNVDEAIARGFETEFKYRFTPAESVYVNYTYEHITDQTGDAGDITQNTPAHKVNFSGMAKFGHGFSGSLNVGYKDHYFISSDGYNTSAAIPAYWRLDARVAYAVNPRTELFLAGQNLAASTHEEFPDGLAIARTYQGGVSIKFGESR
jgi:outer membrane receptor protein involved in Fe transport